MDENLWPEIGATPMVGDAPDWEHNASLPDQPNWVVYRSGYLTALDLVVAYVVEEHRDQDSLVYPIVFLSRHATELGLKHLTLLAARLLDEPVPKMGHHRLRDLWAQARLLIERIDPPPSDEDLTAVEEAIDWFSRMDDSSFTFRYPFDRDQTTPSFELDRSNLKRLISISEFKSWIDRLQHFLDGGIEMYLVYLRRKQDLESEYGP